MECKILQTCIDKMRKYYWVDKLGIITYCEEPNLSFIEQIYRETKIKLNDQQKSAVLHEDGPALVLAGPGSGKTTVIICRLARLIMEKGIKPENIVSLTFNRAAAKEMEQRFNRVFGYNSECKVRFSTLHSFSYSIVRWYQKYKGLSLELIEGSKNKSRKSFILKDLYHKINDASMTDDELDNLIGEMGIIKNGMIRDVGSFNSKIKNFTNIYTAYERYKKDNKLLDFDDMLVYSLAILRRFPDLLNSYREKYVYMQVDEGQDMSRIQFEFVKLLAAPINNLFIVADDDQSIYGFRGAEPGYILDFKKNFEDTKIYFLEQNYRSTENIVEFSSNFIRTNKNRYDKNHKTSNRLQDDPKVVEVKNEKSQIQYILNEIMDLTNHGRKPLDTSIAVLFRNNLSAILLAEMMDREGIDFNLREKSSFFFSHWFMLDILAFMSFSLAQWDSESFLRIYYKTNCFISREMVDFALKSNNGSGILDKILKHDGLTRDQGHNIKRIKNEFRKMASMKPIKALEYIDSNFGFLLSSKRQCERIGSSFSLVQNIFSIMKIIAVDFDTIASFLARIKYIRELFEGGTGKNALVTLSTVHASKGLEYDYVYMIDLYDGEFPNLQSIEYADNGIDSPMEEERRLFYVGLTRARKKVFFISPKIVIDSEVKRSKFIDEMETYAHSRILRHVEIGKTIQHKKYGLGTVLEKSLEDHENIVIKVDFRGKQRLLDLKACINNGVLEILG